MYLDAEVLVLPPVFLPQDSVFVGCRSSSSSADLRRRPTADLGLAESKIDYANLRESQPTARDISEGSMHTSMRSGPSGGPGLKRVNPQDHATGVSPRCLGGRVDAATLWPS